MLELQLHHCNQYSFEVVFLPFFRPTNTTLHKFLPAMCINYGGEVCIVAVTIKELTHDTV